MITMCAIVNIQGGFIHNMEVCLQSLHITVDMPTSNGSFVTTIKQTARQGFHTSTKLLFYILLKISLTQIHQNSVAPVVLPL